MAFSIIVAHSENYIIGKDGELPWSIPVDMERFKKITEGNTVIMGRKTYESIGKPLENRRNIVISTTMKPLRGVEVAKSFEEAVQLARGDDHTFFIGGEDVYKRAIPFVSEIYLTVVDGAFTGDTSFPKLDNSEWVPRYWENQADHSFFILERK